jgi:Transposase DDE domain.
MGIKIEQKAQTITPFGGISFVNDAFTSSGLSALIDKELGIRSKSVGYQYSEIFRNWFSIFFCGGNVAEDIQAHLRFTLENIPSNRVASADTLLRGIKELAVENTVVQVASSGNEYQFNINEKLNDLNIKSLLLTKQLVNGNSYDFDYDNQILAHEKYDAKPTYKKNTGYFPGVATIGDKIVYIENRDGNANVKTGQAETLERAYKLLNKNGIEINRSRMDAGSYSEVIIKVVAKYSKRFYLRANKCEALTETLRTITNWESMELNFKSCEVTSIPFTNFLAENNYRLVVMREKTRDPQLDLFEGKKYNYRCILTDDHNSSEKEVIDYYNNRGACEKTFDIMNNDFGWGHLPCSDINHNTVYLILTAMIKNFYNYIVKKVSEAFDDILPTSRLKKFLFRFICVAGTWIKQSRQWKLRLYTNRPYEKLVFT